MLFNYSLGIPSSPELMPFKESPEEVYRFFLKMNFISEANLGSLSQKISWAYLAVF